jgi:hypothetical protein
MVAAAQQHKIVEVGRSVVRYPMPDVVRITPRFGTITSGRPASSIANRQRPSLHARDKTGLAAHVENLARTLNYNATD